MKLAKHSADIKEIMEGIENSIESHTFAVKYNLKNFIRGLLWEVVLTHDLDVHFGGKLDRVIDEIFATSKYDGPEGEEYPTWNENNVKINKDIKILSEKLQNFGIQQSWNIKNR